MACQVALVHTDLDRETEEVIADTLQAAMAGGCLPGSTNLLPAMASNLEAMASYQVAMASIYRLFFRRG